MNTPLLNERRRPAPDLEPLLANLIRLALDLRWTWSHTSDALWQAIDLQAWELTANPLVVLQNVSRARLQELSRDDAFNQQLQQLTAAHADYIARLGWFGETHFAAGLGGVAYFSMEFGLGAALPLYAGGLGILAGDVLKTASDLGVPLVAVGLLFQEGYFRQMLDSDGWQQEVYPYNDSSSLPVQPVETDSGAWLNVAVEFPGRRVRLRVWQARVGRVALYLLDSNDPLNSPSDRGITSQLYGGGPELRLLQEITLGIGGWRLIEALGLGHAICHINEGHAAFATLERARGFMVRTGVDFWQALWATRAGNVFTTHTPVTAGFDVFAIDLLAKYGRAYADSLKIAPDDLLALGRRNSYDLGEPFNMAFFAARTCSHVNAVSRLHGEVSRSIFQDLYPRWPQCEVPISHVTNGVHVPSWDSPWADTVWTETCGKGRWRGALETLAESIQCLSDEALWTFRGQERADLVQHARNRLARQLAQRGIESDGIDATLDPNVLTLGFARRFASYKRPTLLLRDPERLIRLLTDLHRPVQVIVAGKAHPRDQQGKQSVHDWAQFVLRPEVRTRAVFLEDYDMALAQELVQGVDVWLNTPHRPWEACGTSGMKVLVNGGLNLSALDGWWAEAYSPEVGWALGDGTEQAEADQLYRLLEDEIVPAFYARDAGGIPRAWVARIRASMGRLTPQFSANRMLREYIEALYLPAACALERRTVQGGRLATELRAWEQGLRQHWQGIHWGNLEVSVEADGWLFAVQVYLGEIPPEAVAVELYADAVAGGVPVRQAMTRAASMAGATHGYRYECRIMTAREAAEFTPRIVPYHSDARVPSECKLIRWRESSP